LAEVPFANGRKELRTFDQRHLTDQIQVKHASSPFTTIFDWDYSIDELTCPRKARTSETKSSGQRSK
jgi:hypothetical protein